MVIIKVLKSALAGLFLLASSLTLGCLDASRHDVAITNGTGSGGGTTTVRPTVVSMTPAPNATNVPLGTTVAVTFSTTMDAHTLNANSFALFAGTTPVTGTASFDTTGKVATFSPLSQLAYATVYTVVVKATLADTAGNTMAVDYRASFTTQSQSVDTSRPAVISVTPAANATNVPLGTTVVATFSEALASSSVNTSSMQLLLGTTSVSGVVSLDASGKVATLVPSVPLVASSIYTVVISTAVKDLAGNAMAAEYRSSFTTLSTTPVATPFTLDAQYHATNVATDVTGNVYVYGYFNAPVSDIFLASFDATGKERWFQTVATPVLDWPQGGLVVSKGFVYIQRIRDPLGTGSTEVYVDKFDATTGAASWSTLVDSAAMGSSLVTDDTNLYATTTKSTVKLDFTGAILARTSTGGSVSAFAFNGLLVAGVQYVDAVSLNDRYLTRYDASLAPQWTEWKRDANDQDVRGIATSSTFVYVAEDSYVASATGVQFTPYLTGYTWNSTTNTVTLAWSLPLSGGRVSVMASSSSGACYIANRGPNTLQKVGQDKTVAWSSTLSAEALGIAEYQNAVVYVADDTNQLKVVNATTGARQ